MKSGDVRPANILLNADGEMLLINTLSFPDETTNYRKSLEQHETTYLGIVSLLLSSLVTLGS